MPVQYLNQPTRRAITELEPDRPFNYNPPVAAPFAQPLLATARRALEVCVQLGRLGSLSSNHRRCCEA